MTLCAIAVTGIAGSPGRAESLDEAFATDIAAARGGNNYCEIIVTRNGTIAPNVGASVLSSSGAGGLSGTAQITTTNASFSLVAETPAGFALGPVGGSQDVVFAASVSGSGATTFLQQPGNVPVRLKRGTTQVDAGLTASRLAGAFPAGHYRADLVLRCE